MTNIEIWKCPRYNERPTQFEDRFDIANTHIFTETPNVCDGCLFNSKTRFCKASFVIDECSTIEDIIKAEKIVKEKIPSVYLTKESIKVNTGDKE